MKQLFLCVVNKLPVWWVWSWAWYIIQGTSSSLSYLEKRQEWMLSQIAKLQEKVKVLATNLGVGPAEVGILQQHQVSST